MHQGFSVWASFSGRCTCEDKDREEPIGKHQFLACLKPWNELGAGYDQFWIEIRDGGGSVAADLSMDCEATDNIETLDGGNIVVPHTPN